MIKQVVYRCGECYKNESPCVRCERGRLDLMARTAHANHEDCGREDCQECCPHSDERDHGICLDCGHEEDPGVAIDRAELYYGGDR